MEKFALAHEYFSLMRRKRAFSLLEVLIALVLISLCALPLLNQPVLLVQREVEEIYQAELYAHAELEWGKVKEDLLLNRISWDCVCSPKKKAYLLANQEVEVKLSSTHSRKFQKTVYLWSSRPKQIAQDEEGRLLTVQIIYAPKVASKSHPPHKFCYQVTATGPHQP